MSRKDQKYAQQPTICVPLVKASLSHTDSFVHLQAEVVGIDDH